MVRSENKYIQLLKSWQKLLFNIGIAAVVLIFVIRPVMRKFRKEGSEDTKSLPPPDAGPSIEEQVTALLLEKPSDQISVRKKSAALVKHDPNKATEIIRQWMSEDVEV
jgi:flagellar biosynthesis/type III secretory pathway M-ring protein FliF/YscJ